MSLKIIPHKQTRALSPIAMSEWPFLGLRREMDRIFDNFFSDFELTPVRNLNMDYIPAMDVKETDKEIKITTELPGLEEKDIEVNVSEDSITIKGEKKAEKEEKGEGRYLLERSYGSFYRDLSLPQAINIDKVEAKFRNGILEIHLPKREDAKKKEKKIEVKSAA